MILRGGLSSACVTGIPKAEKKKIAAKNKEGFFILNPGPLARWDFGSYGERKIHIHD